jgi:glycosyltransferase involved in cell wall biosynthesis
LRVLLIHNHYRPPSGENIVFQNEKSLLLEHGLDVVFYERSNFEIDRFTASQRLMLPLSFQWSSKAYSEVSDLIARTRPQIAHVHNTFPLISMSALAACKASNVPVVQTIHNYRFICPGALLQRGGKPCEQCIKTLPLKALFYRCYKNSFFQTAALSLQIATNKLLGRYHKYVSRYIALTQFAASRLIIGGIPGDKIDIKPNFLFSYPSSVPYGDKLLSNAEKFAIYVGYLIPEKGLWTLFAAWKQIEGLKLKVIGDGPMLGDLRRFASRHNLNIEFLGYLEHKHVLNIVRESLMQIIPSHCYENFPMTVLEGYAYGTPIIASRIGSLGEIIIDGRTGLLFEPGNSHDLVEKVYGILHDHELASKISHNARKVFEKKYTPQANIAILKSIYQKALVSQDPRIYRWFPIVV